jgi:hypothetical protein
LHVRKPGRVRSRLDQGKQVTCEDTRAGRLLEPLSGFS